MTLTPTLHDPSDPSRGDHARVQRVLEGDRGSAEALFEGCVQDLFAFVHYRSGQDRARTEDLVQETLAVAVEKLDRYGGEAPLIGWLCGIARNVLRAEGRRRRPRALADVLEETDAELDAILAEVEQEPLPDEVLERKETADLVGATLSSLPVEQRELLVAKYVDGRTVPELARERGQALKATESALFRARKAFGRVFGVLAERRGGFE